MKKRTMSKEARQKISEGMKRRYAKMKNPPPPFFDGPLKVTKSVVEFSGTYNPNNGALTITIMLERYNSIMNSVMDSVKVLQ